MKDIDKIKRIPFFKVYVLPRLLFFFYGLPKGSFLSIDVTKKCNLRCKHCYFFKSNHDKELSLDEWSARFKELKKKNKFLYSATWVGGEPLLRTDVIEKNMHLFPHNLVVTNGSISLPDWKNAYFHISVDGNEKIHDDVRGLKGLYSTIKKNIASSNSKRIKTAMCITNLNKNTIKEVLEDFSGSSLQGFIFDFYTPMLSNKNDPLLISDKEKDEIIDELISYKKGKYNKLIFIEPEVLELMKSKNMNKVVSKCSFRNSGIALDVSGNIKKKCMIGEDADCFNCGCVVPYYLHLRKDKKQIIKEIKNESKIRLREKFKGF